MKYIQYTSLALISAAGFAQAQIPVGNRFDDTQPFLFDKIATSVSKIAASTPDIKESISTRASSSSPKFTLGGGYSQLTKEYSGLGDLDLDIAYLSMGSEIPTTWSPHLMISTDVRLGKSISDEAYNVNGNIYDVDADFFASLSVQAQYNIYMFYVQAGVSFSYLNAEAQSRSSSVSSSGDDFSFGYMVGAGVNITRGLALELNAEFFENDTSAISTGVKFKF